MLPSPDVAPDRPTRARFVVLALLCSLTFILYVDRVCMGQAEQSIRADLGLDKRQMGAIAGRSPSLTHCLRWSRGVGETATGPEAC